MAFDHTPYTATKVGTKLDQYFKNFLKQLLNDSHLDLVFISGITLWLGKWVGCLDLGLGVMGSKRHDNFQSLG